jgi:putative oxidoreductase
MKHVIQRALTVLRAGEWMPITATRVLIGIFFCISGGTKLFVPAQFGVLEQTMVQSHIPFPHANALFVSMVEFACGAGLALGLLTPLCAAMLVGDMIVAIATNRIQSIQASGVLAWLDDFLYLPEVLYTLILVWLIFSGPGRYSVDGLIAWRAGVFGVKR